MPPRPPRSNPLMPFAPIKPSLPSPNVQFSEMVARSQMPAPWMPGFPADDEPSKRPSAHIRRDHQPYAPAPPSRVMPAKPLGTTNPLTVTRHRRLYT